MQHDQKLIELYKWNSYHKFE